MGLKDKVFNKLLNKMLGNVDMEEIQKGVQNGKYDVNKMIGIVENMIGKEASDQLMKQIQEKANKGEQVNLKSVTEMVKNVDFSKVQKKTSSGEIDVNDMKNVLTDIVGNKKGDELIEQAKKVADEIVEEEE